MRVNSAKKIGKKLTRRESVVAFSFAEVLCTLRKSVIRTFGKILANAEYVRLTFRPRCFGTFTRN